MLNRVTGRVLTPQGWRLAEVSMAQRIVTIRELSVPELAGLDPAELPVVLPGFIDLHVHGAVGRDVMQGGDAALEVARFHARHGTTAMLATTMTACEADIERALRGVRRSMEALVPEGARILGVHLEGPFISEQRLGAQPPAVMRGDMARIRRWQALAPILALTLAPEIEGHLALIPELVAQGMRVQLGHTAGSYDDGVKALQAGATGFTHLFNGMSEMSHRQPGIACAALAHAEFAEIIPDLQHVQPGAILAALRAIPKAYGITDATPATGMPDGEYTLGTQRVFKCMGCVRLALGDSLAGSALTMDQALRNLVSLGLDLADASNRLSRFPADYLGLADRGRIEVGAWSDLVSLDAELMVQRVWVQGREIPIAPGRNGPEIIARASA
ncbi:N-acetylglucosamine-6-phosphate deacetylase [Roseateles sp.]|uniref:N-acetylglucosamine-6-phosphate deacetylase n=1 Tax=Roseateles sp. TaxID=1971397 RepID=UPI003BACE92C